MIIDVNMNKCQCDNDNFLNMSVKLKCLLIVCLSIFFVFYVQLTKLGQPPMDRNKEDLQQVKTSVGGILTSWISVFSGKLKQQ